MKDPKKDLSGNIMRDREKEKGRKREVYFFF